jgi:superoxide reductase
MPRLFSYSNFATGSDKVRLYADKHSPVIICDPGATAIRNKPFNVKVRIGITIKHPNTPDHHFEYVQLWNLETLVGEVKLQRASYGDQPVQIETDFIFIPKISLRLTAVAYCNKHGLWQSEEVFISIKD